jgi:hypothetical protein
MMKMVMMIDDYGCNGGAIDDSDDSDDDCTDSQ